MTRPPGVRCPADTPQVEVQPFETQHQIQPTVGAPSSAPPPPVVACWATDGVATRLFTEMEPQLRAFPAKPAHATLRFGEPGDLTIVEQHIDL